MRVAGDGTRLEIDRTDIEAETKNSSSWIAMTPDRGVIGHGTTDLIRRQLDWMDSAASGMAFQFCLLPIHRERASTETAEKRVERQQSTATSHEQAQAHPPPPPANQPSTPKLLVTVTRHPPQSTADPSASQEQQGNKAVGASKKGPTEANNTRKSPATRRGPRGHGIDNSSSILSRPSRASRPGSIREPGSYALPELGSEEESDSFESSDSSDEAQASDSAAPTPEKNTEKEKGELRVHNTQRRRLLSKSQLSKSNPIVNEPAPDPMPEPTSWTSSRSQYANHLGSNWGTNGDWCGVVRPVSPAWRSLANRASSPRPRYTPLMIGLRALALARSLQTGNFGVGWIKVAFS